MSAAKRLDHQCPSAGCPTILEPWQRLCRRCLRRLPGDMRGRFFDAKAPHLRAVIVVEAVRWLGEHPIAAEAARRCGEAPT